MLRHVGGGSGERGSGVAGRRVVEGWSPADVGGCGGRRGRGSAGRGRVGHLCEMTTLGKDVMSKFEESVEDGFKTDASTAGSTLLELGCLSANAALPVVPCYGFMMQRGVRLKRGKKGKKHRMERRRKEAVLLTAAYQAARWSDKLGGSLPEMARCTYNCHARETRQELPGQYSSNKASSCRVSSEGGPEDGRDLKPSVGIRPRRAC